MRFFILLLFTTSLFSCATNQRIYNPNKKYSPSALKEDYTLLRNVLEKKHPSLYWYTPKDSMNFYFDSLYSTIKDSMTELQFGWKVLAPLTNKIHCGHTSFGMSKGWNKFYKEVRIPSFPLYMKIWSDTMVVVANLNRKDSIIKRGTLITSINGERNQQLLQKIFTYLPTDGYADNVNYVRLSSNFPYYHRNIFGLYQNYRVGYIDSTGKEKLKFVSMFIPEIDTTKKNKKDPEQKISKKQLKRDKVLSYRSMSIDTAANTATIILNTFTKNEGKHLRTFFRRSFKKIRKEKIKNIILDIRGNGGGDIGMYILLTKYLRKEPFKVADTSYAIAKSLKPYGSVFKQRFSNTMGLFFLTKKKRDGNYHFGYWERHFFKPKTRNHFDGDLYVLTNGPTFSASTLLCNALKGQDNVKLVGEETGGSAYGNSGIFIPDIVLKNTKLRVRVPLFRLVQFNHGVKNGRGIMPDIYIPPSVEAVVKGIDRKMVIVKEIIADKNKVVTAE
ncbi:S41 family peptidase [Ferruginibacter sp. SUN002]|uniref:S41 family peptidase n=1 Tax=Ferruginibacter sp. SUN002 TaxID=2937789 RepID=UPI003D369E18